MALLLVPGLSVASGPSVPDSDPLKLDGFVGVAGRTVVPASRVTLVGFDQTTLADDFAYMAAVPLTTFWSESAGKAVSSPLLFYQDPMASPSAEETALDAGKGVRYFMDDQVVACGGSLSSMLTVGLDASKALSLSEEWPTEELVVVPSGSIPDTAARLAELGWAWSEDAVVAVIDPAVAPMSRRVEGNLSGSLRAVPVRTGEYTGSIEPSFYAEASHPFDVPKGYGYVEAQVDWKRIDPFPGLLARGKELGLHLYAGDVMVATSDQWNALSGALDSARSFVYTPGSWRAAIVYIPTMGVTDIERPPTTYRVYEPADYTLRYSIYGGVDVALPVVPGTGAKSAAFTLRWQDGSRDLGLFVRDPTGLEVGSALARGTGGAQTLEMPEIGEGAYTVSVVALDDTPGTATFEVDYSWEETMSRDEVGSLVGAAEGAVLASELGAPLLYATPAGVPKATERALDLLGVRKVVLMDLASRGSAAAEALGAMRGAGEPRLDVEEISSFEDAVWRIKDVTDRTRSGRKDVVVTTLDPWSWWLTGQGATNPQGEEWGARFVGPAAYAAALHGCPLFVTESDSRLSCAKSWNNVYWTLHPRATVPPGAMYLSGRAVYDVVEAYGLDRDGMETIVTVADQYDIGVPWDRALVGPATPGRIAGTPVDCAYWVARGALYSHIVFANPAVDPTLDKYGGLRWVGSRSQRGLGRLVELAPAHEAKLNVPVTFTWACYLYKFNERASEYWGAKYVAADGSIPGFSPSTHKWDGGTVPDMSEDVYSRYSTLAGFGEAESAAYDETIINLNRGSILWIETMHGGSGGGGVVGWWSSDLNEEPNPHRGYEEVAGRYMGCTEDPDVLVMDKYSGMDTLPCSSPIFENSPVPERHDGVVLAYLNQDPQTFGVYGADLDRDLENLHSMGLFAGSCSISNTFLHLALIRHGSAFQIIDPWLTSWYVELGQELFYRDVGYGERTVGEAYEHAISLIGSEYVTQDWFWDHWENIVFFGEPDIRMYTPFKPWDKPQALEEDLVLDGHAVMSASEHPAEIGRASTGVVLMALGAALLAVEAYVHLAERPAEPELAGRPAAAARWRPRLRRRPKPTASSPRAPPS